MQLGDFMTRFMETVLRHGELGRLQMQCSVHGKPVLVEISIELLAFQGRTS